MKKFNRCFEVLESREMMDAAPVPTAPVIAENVDAPALIATTVDGEEAIDVSSLFEEAASNLVAKANVAESGDVVVVPEIDGAPEAPTNLSFGSYDSEKTDLETVWDASTSEDVLGYVAEYSVDGGETWRVAGYEIGNVDGRIAKGVGKYATYIYRVAAFNQYKQSDWVYAEWNYGEYIKPGEITFGAYDANTKTLEYSWGASASTELAYYPCEYSLDGGQTWKLAGNVKFNRTYRVATKVDGVVMFRTCAMDADGFRSPWVYATFDATAV